MSSRQKTSVRDDKFFGGDSPPVSCFCGKFVVDQNARLECFAKFAVC